MSKYRWFNIYRRSKLLISYNISYILSVLNFWLINNHSIPASNNNNVAQENNLRIKFIQNIHFLSCSVLDLFAYICVYNEFHRMIYNYGGVGLIIRWSDEEGLNNLLNYEELKFWITFSIQSDIILHKSSMIWWHLGKTPNFHSSMYFTTPLSPCLHQTGVREHPGGDQWGTCPASWHLDLD